MAEIKATLSEMRSAARKISGAANEYLKVAGQVLSSAEALGASWEGDSQVAFMAEQQKANEWYRLMTDLVNEYVKALYNAADDYEETDTSAAALIRQK